MKASKVNLDHGAKFPYDAPDSWWHDGHGVTPPPPAKDWAHAAARGILADLQDRRGIKHGFGDVDEATRVEIVNTMADIIREAVPR